MSEITGNGHGDKHDWKKGDTIQSRYKDERSTLWTCNNCTAAFRHYYHVVTDIFEAMKFCNIPIECEKKET
jgi:hypothetical protein